MKRFYTLIIALLIASSAMTQTDDPCESCLPDGIHFENQYQIDSFPINYPNCTEIEGGVLILGDDIYNLNALSVITEINGNLTIGDWDVCNPNLTTLSGLDNLISVGGGFGLSENGALNSLSALSSLTTVGGLYIDANYALTDLRGLENLDTIDENLVIAHNDILTSLNGLDNLAHIGVGLDITYNHSLDSLNGFGSLTTIGGTLYILDNSSLKNIFGFANLVTIGDSYAISGNDSLLNLSGFNNLSSIGGDFWIHLNVALNSLSGLESYFTIGGDVRIFHNYNSLSECDIESICEYLIAPNGTIQIQGNASGCNTQDEVEDACGITTLDEMSNLQYLIIYPNPSHTTITIELPTQPSKNTSLTISNTNGHQLITQAITKPQTEIDISHHPAGIYIVKVWNDKEVMVRKVIKQ